MIKWLQGKKTYLVAAVVFVLGGIQALQAQGMIDWTIPSWVYVVLSALGLGALRSGVKRSENVNIGDLVERRVQSILKAHGLRFILVASLAVSGLSLFGCNMAGKDLQRVEHEPRSEQRSTGITITVNQSGARDGDAEASTLADARGEKLPLAAHAKGHVTVIICGQYPLVYSRSEGAPQTTGAGRGKLEATPKLEVNIPGK